MTLQQQLNMTIIGFNGHNARFVVSQRRPLDSDHKNLNFSLAENNKYESDIFPIS